MDRRAHAHQRASFQPERRAVGVCHDHAAGGNPANCPATDGWVAIDSVFSKVALAMALTAIAAGHQIQLVVSASRNAH